ncbi:MAG: hypothetical protein IT428_14400 [Planctomycetaceae bacterium]|nr:hypothetical protein [Planctomycetaceae bacterium]
MAEARACLSAAVSEDASPRSRFVWAAYLSRQGDSTGAAVEWRRLWESTTGTEHESIAGDAAHNLACLERRRGDFAAANSWQQRALASRSRGSLAVMCEASDFVAAANDAMGAGRWRDAERLLRAGLRRAHLDDDTQGAADILGSCGVLHQLRGRLAKAIALHRDACRLHEQAGDDTGAACDCLNLAGIAIRLGRPRAALSAARHACQFAVRSGERPLIDQADERVATIRRALAKLSRPVHWN